MTASRLEALVREHKRRAWALAYRILGTAPAADLVVHDALLQVAPGRPGPNALGPALEARAACLARERLRARRRRGYTGPWLPGPVDTARVVAHADAPDVPPPRARWTPLESGSFGFLVALELLGPRQRAVAVLCDAFGRTEEEAARALGLEAAEVDAARRRARDVLERYELGRAPPGPSLQVATVDVLGQLLAALIAEDVPALGDLLAVDAAALGDGGGEVAAPRVPVRGPDRIAALLVALVGRDLAETRIDVRELNGLPALVVRRDAPPPGHAAHLVLRAELDLQGKVAQVHVILAREKLAGLLTPTPD
ncbi:MAG: RNA polymerase subunit sigma [Planctomycetes bacterium]|nr:RNA polymerase subunit sigma [Planctomycetota bacterium]